MKYIVIAILFSSCFFRRYPAPVEDTFEPVAEAPEPEVIAPLIDVNVKATQPSPEIVRWPRDRDLSFKITYCSDARLQMQWRQVCGSFDSDWYDMLEKGMVDPLDADYMVTRAVKSDSAECVDLVTVMAAKMRGFPRSGCEWSFRTRLISKRNVYQWVNLGERIVLADPGEFEQINLPKIELINRGEKANTPN